MPNQQFSLPQLLYHKIFTFCISIHKNTLCNQNPHWDSLNFQKLYTDNRRNWLQLEKNTKTYSTLHWTLTSVSPDTSSNSAQRIQRCFQANWTQETQCFPWLSCRWDAPETPPRRGIQFICLNHLSWLLHVEQWLYPEVLVGKVPHPISKHFVFSVMIQSSWSWVDFRLTGSSRASPISQVLLYHNALKQRLH